MASTLDISGDLQLTLTSLVRDSINTFWPRPAAQGVSGAPSGGPDFRDAPPDVRRLIRDRRYCQVLTNDAEVPFDEKSVAFAWRAIAQHMALVPAGEVSLAADCAVSTGYGLGVAAGPPQRAAVNSLYVDRAPVTNAEYARFVAAGGYSNADLWPPEVLSSVLQFVDRTGHPGPRDWRHGEPLPGKEDHPVVGVSWYEANAYAHWTGKRLPTSAGWQRAATWSKSQEGGCGEPRYPWGNAFEPERANTWPAGQGDTVPVDAFSAGRTPNGIHQLVGNVWEWIDGQFHLASDQEVHVLLEQTMAEIRGGAFDTYFHTQATCQFRSGLPLASRRNNVGFRCCIGGDRLPPPPDPKAFLVDHARS